MRRITLCLLLALLGFCGCKEEKKTVVTEPLIPTRRELEMLRAYRIDPTTQAAQKKLQKYRQRQEKLKASRERVTQWAEESAKRRAEDGEEEERRVPLNGLYQQR